MKYLLMLLLLITLTNSQYKKGNATFTSDVYAKMEEDSIQKANSKHFKVTYIITLDSLNLDEASAFEKSLYYTYHWQNKNNYRIDIKLEDMPIQNTLINSRIIWNYNNYLNLNGQSK